jgi:short-subunit dehydrogenase
MSRGTIVITGASSGLGEEMARQFAALGYGLGLCARRLDRLAVLRDELTAVAALAEGLRAERIPGVDVSLICPGYIRSEMSAAAAERTRFMVDTGTGVAAMVRAIEARKTVAYVPRWPWAPLSVLMKRLPLPVVRRLT